MTYSKKIVCYKNGNYNVKIYEDGTKVRFTDDDEFKSIFPESIDIKITNYCDSNCKMCHEESNIDGAHGNLNHFILDSLKPGMELAIGGGNPLAHPELISFLNRMKEKKVICNLTINQKHFTKNIDLLKNLMNNKLIFGLGISIINDFDIDEIISFANKSTNVVLHVIAGIIDEKILQLLYNKNLKILILGYKQMGRGESYYNIEVKNKILYLKNNIIEISEFFNIVYFDNLAVSQLNIKSKISKEEYETYYMGADGLFTMYIDLVKEEFAISSTALKRFKLYGDIEMIFNFIKNNK